MVLLLGAVTEETGKRAPFSFLSTSGNDRGRRSPFAKVEREGTTPSFAYETLANDGTLGNRGC